MKEYIFLKKLLCNYDVHTIDIINGKNILNIYTKMIYVINLENNIIRKNYILTIMKKYGISFKLVTVKKIKQEYYNYYCKYENNISISELGCGLSHLWCLKNIVENKYKNAIIFEDDIIFHKNFEKKFNKIIQKQNYDFLLLGACDFHFSEVNYKNVNKNLYTILGDTISDYTPDELKQVINKMDCKIPKMKFELYYPKKIDKT